MQEIEVQDGFLQNTKTISLVDFSFVFYTLLNYRKIRPTDKLITKQAQVHVLPASHEYLFSHSEVL